MTSKQKLINVFLQLIVTLIFVGLAVFFFNRAFNVPLHDGPIWFLANMVPSILLGFVAFYVFVFTIAMIFADEKSIFSIVVKAGSYAIAYESGNVDRVFEADQLIWPWSMNYGVFGSHDIVKAEYICFTDKSSFLIHGDRVRQIICDITIKPPTTLEGCQTLKDTIGLDIVNPDSSCSKPISSLILDFCESHGVELVELYNPHREEQQARFRSLAEVWFTPKLLAYGLGFENATFDVSE